MTSRDLPILILERDFKKKQGKKEIINFGVFVCIAVRTSDYVFALGWKVDERLTIRKFASKSAAERELDLSINLDNAVVIPSNRYDLKDMAELQPSFYLNKSPDICH